MEENEVEMANRLGDPGSPRRRDDLPAREPGAGGEERRVGSAQMQVDRLEFREGHGNPFTRGALRLYRLSRVRRSLRGG